MPTPDNWHKEAKKVLEKERASSSDKRPPFSMGNEKRCPGCYDSFSGPWCDNCGTWPCQCVLIGSP